MKRHLVIRILIVCLCCVSYAANAQSKKKLKTIQDKDGNTYEIKSMPGKLTWMMSNLNVTIPDSYLYYNADSNALKYGRLYPWQVAQDACKQLGEGWRLPTDEEWQKMTQAYGGVAGNSKDTGNAAFQALTVNGKSGFNAVFGGRRDESRAYWMGKNVGYYWTATEADSTQAWTYIFYRREKKLTRESEEIDKRWALSVRCVKGK